MRKHVIGLCLTTLTIVTLSGCDRLRSPIGPPPGDTPTPPIATVVRPPANPTTPPGPTPATPTPATSGGQPGNPGSAPVPCTFPAPSGDPDSWPKVLIEQAPANTWFHRVFNVRLFRAPAWDGADSWFVNLALGPHSGGLWTSHGNPGQIVHRGENTHQSWCLGVLTTDKWKEQFMGRDSTPAGINVRIAPNSIVSVRTASGQTVNQATSDAGDITIILPNSGVIVIAVDYTTAAPTHESLVWWGPYDRSANINTIDAR